MASESRLQHWHEITKPVATAEKDKYWEDILSTHYEGVLGMGDLPLGEDELDPALDAEAATFRIEFMTESRYEDLKKYLIPRMREEEPEEDWNPRNANFIAWVWEGDAQEGEPQGFMTMNISVDRNPSGRITEMGFDQDLIWIAPQHRGRKLGRYLTEAVWEWLSYGRAYGKRVTPAGLLLHFHAEAHSEGGEVLARRMFAHFDDSLLLQADGVSPRNLGWNLRELFNGIEGLSPA